VALIGWRWSQAEVQRQTPDKPGPEAGVLCHQESCLTEVVRSCDHPCHIRRPLPSSAVQKVIGPSRYPIAFLTNFKPSERSNHSFRRCCRAKIFFSVRLYLRNPRRQPGQPLVAFLHFALLPRSQPTVLDEFLSPIKNCNKPGVSFRGCRQHAPPPCGSFRAFSLNTTLVPPQTHSLSYTVLQQCEL
jgi:hypothetical protein